MERIKPLSLNLQTEEEQAEYFVKMKFDFIPVELIDIEDYLNNADLIYPSKGKIMQIKLDEDIVEDYEIYEDFAECKEVYLGIYKFNEYSSWEKEEKFNVDVLYDFGLFLIYYKGEYFLNIPAFGVDFIKDYFVPFFKYLGWIKYEN
jgi:hypothetical protein